MAKISIYELGRRTNINVYSLHPQYNKERLPLVIYEDHRTLIYVLWHARHFAKCVKKPVFLIYFDAHPDSIGINHLLGKLKDFRENGSQKTPSEVHSFVEWELSSNDDDWLYVAFELGLVEHAVWIGNDCASPSKTTYTDQVGGKHEYWEIPHLWRTFGKSRKSMQNPHSRDAVQSLLRQLGWDSSTATFNSTIPLVLDWDLDCFAQNIDERLAPWPFASMKRQFNIPIVVDNRRMTSSDLLFRIMHQCALMTIARESPFCGGMDNSQRILNALDRVVFDDALFKHSISS